MDTVKIQTTQNVNLSYTPAGVGLRILAGLLDMIFVYGYFTIVVLIFAFSFGFFNAIGDSGEMDDSQQMVIGFLILFLLPGFFYHLLCETFLNGQSFGKKIMKIKVIKVNGTQPNFGSYVIRSMFRLIDISLISPAIALITIAVSNKSQRFGDMVAGTTVIQIMPPISLKETIFRPQTQGYQIVYAKVHLLTDKDANIIRQVLDFSRTQNQPQHLALLKKKIQEKYGIKDISKNDVDFFETMLKDYNHYQFEQG